LVVSYDMQAGIDRFHRDGFEKVPDVLTPKECRDMIAALANLREELPLAHELRWVTSHLLFRDPVFEVLIDRSPMVDMAEKMLMFERGDMNTPKKEPTCHIINVTGIVADPGDGGQPWHADDMILLPRPADVPWDDRIPFPVYLVTAMYYLVDVDREMGATLVVPGSHKSGRKPDSATPSYQGREAEEVIVRAGDCLLFHHLLWHRALPHRGPHTRFMLQVHYAARFVAPRMLPFPNHHTPVAFLDRLTPRQQRLMGMHSGFREYC